MYGGDVRVIERCKQLGFTIKAGQSFRVSSLNYS